MYPSSSCTQLFDIVFFTGFHPTASQFRSQSCNEALFSKWTAVCFGTAFVFLHEEAFRYEFLSRVPHRDSSINLLSTVHQNSHRFHTIRTENTRCGLPRIFGGICHLIDNCKAWNIGGKDKNGNIQEKRQKQNAADYKQIDKNT